MLTTVANVFMSASVGSWAYMQPGTGRAHLAGVDGMPALNADTAYGPALFATALSATFLLMLPTVVLAVPIARTSRRLQMLGIAYAVLLPAFAISGLALQSIQVLTGFALAAATAALAVQLPLIMGDPAGSRGLPTSVRASAEV